MVRANKTRINKYKSEYIIKLVRVYVFQERNLTADNINTKMGNINGGEIRMNYININHLVQLYDNILRCVSHGLTVRCDLTVARYKTKWYVSIFFFFL